MFDAFNNTLDIEEGRIGKVEDNSKENIKTEIKVKSVK